MNKKNVDYNKLYIHLPTSYYAKYHKQKRLAKLLGSSLLLRLPLRVLSRLFPFESLTEATNMADSYARTEKHIKILKSGNKEAPSLLGSSYGYKDEKTELTVAKYYKEQLLERNAKPATESFDLYDHAIDVLSNLLKKDSSIRKISDFGVSYAYVDSALAEKFPDISFVGIDRSKLTKQFNEDCFKNLPNISFQAEDIFDYLESDHSDSVLFHMRTCTVLPQHSVSDLYEKARKSNVKYIVGMEQIGLSRQTDAPYLFSEDKQDSVVFRLFMYIHNYPGILRECGYDLERIELVKTAHHDEDFRILSFTARKRI